MTFVFRPAFRQIAEAAAMSQIIQPCSTYPSRRPKAALAREKTADLYRTTEYPCALNLLARSSVRSPLSKPFSPSAITRPPSGFAGRTKGRPFTWSTAFCSATMTKLDSGSARTPATEMPFSTRPTDIPHMGKPRKKFAVPSIGSIAHPDASASNDPPCSSPMIATLPNLSAMALRMLASMASSASDTNCPADFSLVTSSSRRTAYACARVTAGFMSSVSCSFTLALASIVRSMAAYSLGSQSSSRPRLGVFGLTGLIAR